MATPITLPWMNHNWKPPQGMPECKPLPALCEDGKSTSVWAFDSNEMGRIIATQCVAVTIWGRQPPIAVGTLDVEPGADRYTVTDGIAHVTGPLSVVMATAFLFASNGAQTITITKLPATPGKI